MRISNWSSDVCSSDLSLSPRQGRGALRHLQRLQMEREDRADHRGVDGTLRWRGTGHGNESGLRVAYFRHPGLAPGSNAPQAPAFMDNWTPEQVRDDDARS